MAKPKKEALTVVSNDPVDLDAPKVSETADNSAPTETETASKTEQENATKTEAEKPASSVSAAAEKAATEEVPIDEDAPPPPPRPISPITRITKDLKDAFPNIEDKLITAVLIASQGQVDPAFNALLYISDPSFKPEIPVPSQAPPPVSKSGPKTVTDDELLARELQKEFEREEQNRRRRHEQRLRRKLSQDQRRSRVSEENDLSPDEFDQIKETFTQGLEDARSTLNGWVSGFSKKLLGEADQPNSQKQNPKLFGALGGSSFNSNTRRARFDEDPEIISHDFHNKINLSNNDDHKDLPNLPQRRPENAPEAKKWEPLNSDVPVNSDAFLVTDSEEEDLAGNKKSSTKF